MRTFKSRDVLDGLVEVKTLMERGRTFEALRKIRALFVPEDEILKTRGLVAAELQEDPIEKSVA
jgi:flagellar biosynthesis regulator FlbT